MQSPNGRADSAGVHNLQNFRHHRGSALVGSRTRHPHNPPSLAAAPETKFQKQPADEPGTATSWAFSLGVREKPQTSHVTYCFCNPKLISTRSYVSTPCPPMLLFSCLCRMYVQSYCAVAARPALHGSCPLNVPSCSANLSTTRRKSFTRHWWYMNTAIPEKHALHSTSPRWPWTTPPPKSRAR